MLYLRQLTRHATYIAFVENQLSPNLIGLSPLVTSPLYILQHVRVRSSCIIYYTINLLMTRSFGFGSNQNNFSFFQTRFRYAFQLAILIYSLTHDAKGTLSHNSHASTAFKHWISGSFHSFLRFFSTFPHGTLFTID